MNLKAIELLVLQKGALERIKLVDIDLEDQDSELTYHFNPESLHEKFWTGISEQYEVNNLLFNYVYGVRRLHRVVTEIVKGTGQEDKASLKVITKHPYVYASPEAYDIIKPKCEKEKSGDLDLSPVAHLSWKEGIEYGIFVSLMDHYSYQNILSSNIHEHGHYLHFILNSGHYNECDSTLKEAMAIFMERKCGLNTNYMFLEPGKETPHHRAQQLLQQLEKIEFYSYMGNKEQWEFLAQFKTHQALQELTVDISSNKDPEIVVDDEK